MVFYSSAAVEEALDVPYMESLRANRAEQKERAKRTGVNEKWLASSSVEREPRRFIVQGGRTYFHTVAPANECPDSSRGGKRRTYRVDGDFRDQVASFQAKHSDFTVTFNEGPVQLGYCAADGALPCVFEAASGEKLKCEDEDKWDLCVG